MATVVKNGQEITLGSTTEIEYEIFGISPDQEYTALIDVPSTNSGTIQFSVGETVGPNQKAVAAGSKIYLTFKKGDRNIRVKGSNSADKITFFV